MALSLICERGRSYAWLCAHEPGLLSALAAFQGHTLLGIIPSELRVFHAWSTPLSSSGHPRPDGAGVGTPRQLPLHQRLQAGLARLLRCIFLSVAFP